MAGMTMSGIPRVTSTANFYSNTNPLLQSRGIGGFAEPSALFGNSEQGAWWDFSDLANMWQENSGFTPAALEQPVGLVLDKRFNQGQRGPELAPAQNNPALWIATSSLLSTDGTNLTVTNSGATEGYATVPPALVVAGNWYELSVTRTGGNSSGSIVVGANRVGMSAIGVTAHYVFQSNSTTIQFGVNSGTLADSVSFKASVKSLGVCNNLIQATAGARPTLSRRFNWVTSTRDYSGWTLGAGIATALQSNALSTDSAMRVTYAGATGTANDTRFEKITSVVPGGTASKPFTETVYIKSANSNQQTCRIKLTQSAVIDNFSPDLVISTAWQPFTFAVTNTATPGNSQMLCGIAADSANNAFDVLVSRFDCRLTSDTNLAIPAYQWVDTATSYDTLGFPAYLLFDGATKWMQSAVSVDITAFNQLSAFWGCSKFSDAVIGMIAEPTGGLYSLNAPRSNTANTYGVDFRDKNGSGLTDRVDISGYTAPTTDVVFTQMDASTATSIAAQLQVQANGILPTQNYVGTGPFPVGNFNSDIVYVGARTGTSLFFNGRMFGLILRATLNSLTNTNDALMVQKWMGSKCGKFF